VVERLQSAEDSDTNRSDREVFRVATVARKPGIRYSARVWSELLLSLLNYGDIRGGCANGLSISHERTIEICVAYLGHYELRCQLNLRWLTQREVVGIPKSVRKERIVENFNIFDV